MPKQKPSHNTTPPEDELLDKLKTIAKMILEDSAKDIFTFDELLDRVEYSLISLEQERMKTGFRLIDSIIPDFLNQINTVRSKTVYLPGIFTGLNDLDDVLVGLQPGCLYIIGGHPGVGKTGLALTILRNVAVNTNEAVGIFSLELNALQVVTRLLCIEAQLDSHMIRTGRLSKVQFLKLVEASNKLKHSYIYIDDTPWASLSRLKAKARRLKVECNVKLLVIDYLQLIKKCEDSASVGEVRKIFRTLKLLAAELNIPIILLAQLTSQLEDREDKRPKLRDFKYSDVINETSDVILLIYRPCIYDNNSYEPEEVEIIIAKNYNSPTGTAKVKFNPGYAGFE